MNIERYIKQLVVYSLLFVGFVACTNNYEDYNTNPGGTTQEEQERDLYALRGSMSALANVVVPTQEHLYQFVECLMGASYGGYFADATNSFNDKNFSTYVPVDLWVQAAFNDILHQGLQNHRKIYELSEDPIVRSYADVMKIMAVSKVSDIYGPIPYSKAGESGGTNDPYDSQEILYKKLLEELDEAINILTENRTTNISPKADRVYEGITEKWIKLANSLKLRLAMRIVKREPNLAQEKFEEVANHVVGAIADNGDNASVSALIHPLYYSMYTWNDGDSKISADIASYMNGYEDPRREKYFTISTFNESANNNVKNGYHGLRSGIVIPSGSIPKQYSRSTVKSSDRVLWFNAAEVAFLKAEGALRGWNMGKSAGEFYNEGIQLSFTQWSAGDAIAYYSDANKQPQTYKDPQGVFSYAGVTSATTIKWDSRAAFEANLERLIIQKWIAMYPLGIEAWSDYRRTGYPKLMEVVINNSGGEVDSKKMARRLRYPQDEYSTNLKNVTDAVNQYLHGSDEMGVDVWWAR